MTVPENTCRHLAMELRRVLGAGLPLSGASMHYIDSTLAAPTAQQLQAVLTDESNCERDPLLELVFSPDEDTQIRIEPLLEQAAFTKQDLARVVDHLVDPPTVIRLALSPDRGQVEVVLTSDGARRLVGLLHIEKQLDPELDRAIEAHADGRDAVRVKVALRNARCRFCARDVAFLARLLKELDFSRPADGDSLQYALTILADCPAPADIYQVLAGRKRIYTRQLQTARKRDEMLRRSNPEIMMLQGRPIGGIDAAEARRLIAMIDRISVAGFNRTEPAAPPAREAGFDLQDRKDAFKFFI